VTIPEERLTGVKVLLTGATGGVGQALAERLGASGADLILQGRRAGDLEALADSVGGRAHAGDLSERTYLGSLASYVADRWGEPPDVLINNAGAFELAAVTETDPDTFEALLSVNLRAPFELVRALLPGMLRRGSGQLVTIGSVAGRAAFPGNAAYAASKFGLRGLHEVLVEELKGTGVKATWVEPSAVDTPLWNSIDPDDHADLPSRRQMLRPEAVAQAVIFAIAQPADVTIEAISIRANIASDRT
jgi:NADP-dependent 3-hydroxy acid dehydrogenase YdfG